jgi:hypothetical protein
MDFDLDDLIIKIKSYALDNGFVAVDTYKLNLNSNADTQLPKLFIKVDDVNIDKFLNGQAEFDYNLDLMVIVPASVEKPTIEILDKARVLLRALFAKDNIFSTVSVKNKIEFDGFQLTDDQSEYSRYGGAFGAIKIKILNTELI